MFDRKLINDIIKYMNSNSKNLLGRPRAQEGLDRRERLLDCAFPLFASQGVAATTLAQVARAAEVTPAMAHYYFSGRDGLIDAFVEERVVPIMGHVWNALPLDKKPHEVLETFVDCLLAAVEHAPMLPRLWSREVLNDGGCLRQKVMAHFPKERFAALCNALAEAQQSGIVRKEVIPSLAFTAVMGVVMLPLAARDVFEGATAVSLPDKEALRRHALAILLHGMLITEGET